MSALTLSLFILGYGFRGPGRINRLEGGLLLACFVGYTVYLISTTFTS
jgi:cation:H+ antiporter